MTYDRSFKGVVNDVRLNKNIGNFSFWAHRITGIGLSVYLVMHFYVLSAAISGPASFTERMSAVQNPFFAVLEVLLVAGVLFHMLNGLRITISDFFAWSRTHKVFFYAVIALFVIMMVIVILYQVPKFNPDNYI